LLFYQGKIDLASKYILSIYSMQTVIISSQALS
jgi:hypothetical protein